MVRKAAGVAVLAATAGVLAGAMTSVSDGGGAGAPGSSGVTIEAAAFLAGDWSAQREASEGETNFTQEVWSEPSGNNIMGMFRWVGEDGQAAVFEMLTITEEEGTLVLRLRHQDARGVAWEAPDEPATLNLSEHRAEGDDGGPMLAFTDTTESCDIHRCTYERIGLNTLRITVEFDPGHQDDLVFELAIAASSTPALPEAQP